MRTASALALGLLVACGGDGKAGSETAASGDVAAAATTAGAGGTDGAGGGPASVAASSASSTASAASASASTAEVSTSAGTGGAASSGGGSGGSGGAPCLPPACDDLAEVDCRPECPAGEDCDVAVCVGDEQAITIGLGENLIQLPPVVVAYDACESCPGVMYALTFMLPNIEDGCVAVEAPPGVTWDTSAEALGCPEEALGCERAPIGPERFFVRVAVNEPSDLPRDVRVIVYKADNCVGVPAPDCSGFCE